MRRIAVCLMMSACLLMAPAAWATWGTFTSTGSANGLGNPSCTLVSTGQAACAARSSKSAIMVNTFNGASWGTWKSLIGTVVSDPSCTNDGKGDVFCAATASNGDLEVTVLKSGVWSTPANVAAALYSAPSCAEYIAGEVLCAARSPSGGLAWSRYNGTAWSAFASLTTSTVSAPGCTSDDNGGVICAVSHNRVRHARESIQREWVAWFPQPHRHWGRQWAGLHKLASSWRRGLLRKGYGSPIFLTTFNGLSWIVGDWSDFLDLDGEANDNVGCTSQAAGQLVCGGIGIGVGNATFFADVYNGSVWTGWAQVGEREIGTPACAPLGTGQAVCVVSLPIQRRRCFL